MTFDSTTEWLDLLVNCFRADLINRVYEADKEPDQETGVVPNLEETVDLTFELNFESYRDAIVYMVNAYILVDEKEFENLFESFKAEVRANFNPSETTQDKQSLVDDILFPRLKVINTSRDRLGRILVKKWETEENRNKDFSYSKAWRYEFIELALNSTKEGQLERNFSYPKNEHDQAVAKQRLDDFLRDKQPRESQLYLLIKAALLTNKFLESYLQIWKPTKPVNKETISSIGLNALSTQDTFNVPAIYEGIQGDLFDILKPYFKPIQQSNLKNVLLGQSDGIDRLTFTENGNRLVDVFKKLFNAQLIVGCQKVDLEKWIARNFKFIDSRTKQEKDFTAKYLSTIISGSSGCQSPIINIKTVGDKFKIESVRRNTKKNDNI